MDYIQALKDLLALDTTVPPGRNYEKAIDFLDPLFKQAGCQTEKVCIPREFAGGLEGRVNLVINRRNPGKPRLIFYTHVDVVPARGWEAFTPRVEDGKVFGRGAVDMKGEIISLLIALDRLKGREIKYDASAVITVDEEIGHADSEELRYIRPYLEPVTGAAFFSLDAESDYVQAGSLGLYACHITVYGKSVHQGWAFLGENAVENAIKLCQPLLQLGQEIKKRKSQVPAPPGLAISYLQPNLAITMMHGGIKENIIPDECVITVGRRIIPEENLEEAEREILDALRTVPNIRWDIKRVNYFNPLPSAINDPEAIKLSRTLQAVTGKTGMYGFMASVPLDVPVKEWKARIFGTGLSRPAQNPHGINEHTFIKDVEDLATIIEKFLTV
jgi:succinyl-diaminopimelate desuccinylase